MQGVYQQNTLSGKENSVWLKKTANRHDPEKKKIDLGSYN